MCPSGIVGGSAEGVWGAATPSRLRLVSLGCGPEAKVQVRRAVARSVSPRQALRHTLPRTPQGAGWLFVSHSKINTWWLLKKRERETRSRNNLEACEAKHPPRGSAWPVTPP